MSKFGWSYPPGVTESMLPGNSKEEQEAEAAYDAIYDLFDKHIKGFDMQDANEYEELADAIYKMLGEAYAKGRVDGIADDRFAREIEATKENSND